VIKHVPHVPTCHRHLVHCVSGEPILTISLALLNAQLVHLEIMSLEHVNTVTLDAVHVKVEILLNVVDVMKASY
jgi:hypothetical protein